MKVLESELSGVRIIEPKVFADDRGYFLETFQTARYGAAGFHALFDQDNLSFSQQGVLRGLHLQNPDEQAKLVSVLAGEVFDVAVDVRRGSPQFGRWAGFRLSAENKRQVYIPEGFAHGFCVLSETALFAYKCSVPYSPDSEITLRWSDPAIGIDWPVSEPLLSPRDAAAPLLSEISPDRLPQYAAVAS
jgi:dTDP-4-dehydrorhamnose 3,5-epimerase